MSTDPRRPSAAPPSTRTVYVANRRANQTIHPPYPKNYVKTTKYTAYNFLFRALFIQFMRLANIYFLIVAVLQSIPEISPLQPFSAITPLVFVLCLSMAREGLEDYGRNRDDKFVNNQMTEVWDPASRSFRKERWRDVEVGDIIKVNDRETFPADLIVLSTSEEDGLCFIETASLDGEKNLKVRQAVKETVASLPDLDAVGQFTGVVKTEMPNERLYKFEGSINLGAKEISVDANQLLLRGALLRNTKWILGLAVFTGHDTKLMRNGNVTRVKQSDTERTVNKLIVVIIFIQLALCLLLGILSGVWTSNNLNDAWYISQGMASSDKEPGYTGFIAFWSFFLLLNTMIPISLIVSLEVVKVVQAWLISQDIYMYYPQNNIPAKAVTSTLNEELGQVRFVFSDKTGTLTSNKMEFKCVSIGGIQYGDLSTVGQTSSPKPAPAAPVSSSPPHLPLVGVSPGSSSPLADRPRGDTEIIGENSPSSNRSSGASPTAGSPPANSLNVPSPQSSRAKRNSVSVALMSIKNLVMSPFQKTGMDLEGSKKRERRAASTVWSFADGNLDQHMETGDSIPLNIHELGPNEGFVTQRQLLLQFFSSLAVCHSCIPEKHMVDGQEVIDYQGSSPDEVTLVDAAAKFGFKFLSRNQDTVEVSILGEVRKYQILAMVPFSSERKRMTVICRTPEGRIQLYCKGADSIILSRLRAGRQPFEHSTRQHLHSYSLEGLRTLCIAMKNISEADYALWAESWDAAITSIENRDQEVARTAEMMERDLLLLGATAVEDKLQDGVPETIKALREAGINVWVLTGDKLETAVNISNSCQLLDNSMHLLIVDTTSKQMTKSKLITLREQQIQKKAAGVVTAFVIDGTALTYALEEDCLQMFIDISTNCKSVVCCRVSPLQKAEVVKVIKHAMKVITLGIGDGANDVGMIKEAHIGIGIFGEEGMQAVQASDYAIAQFRFLYRLVLVHGRWCYLRIADLILYFFYKNICFTLPELWFAIYSGFSGQTLFEDWYITTFNLMWTALPLVIRGVIEQDVAPEEQWDEQPVHLPVPASNRWLSKYFPRLYYIGRDRTIFTIKNFWISCFIGAWHSVICFFVPMYVMGDLPMDVDGKILGFWSMSVTINICVVFVVTFRMAFLTRYWTPMNHVAIWGSLAVYICFIFGYDSISETKVERIAANFFGCAPFWLTLVFCIVACLIPDFAFEYWRRSYFTNLTDHFQEIQYMKKHGFPGVPKDDEATPAFLRRQQEHNSKTQNEEKLKRPESSARDVVRPAIQVNTVTVNRGSELEMSSAPSSVGSELSHR